MTRLSRPLPGFNGYQLKLLALLTMTLDHWAVVFQPKGWYWLLRLVGRMAFPLYCFLLVEGFCHTRNRKRYGGRLLLMAVVSDLPFDLMAAGHWPAHDQQSVMSTLLLGLVTLAALNEADRFGKELCSHPRMQKLLLPLVKIAIAFVGILLGEGLGMDYGGGGVLLILVFYLFRHRILSLSVVSALVLGSCFGPLELPGLAALIPIALYNGQRGPMPGGKAGQWLFYWYYPLHISLLVLLAEVLGRNHFVFQLFN